MSEEVLETEVQESPVVEEEVQVPAEPALQVDQDETLQVSTEEARSNNYVPYDRFKAVIEERNTAQNALEDRQRILDYYATRQSSAANAQPTTAPESSNPYSDEYVSDEDKALRMAQAAQQDAQRLRMEIAAERQAQKVNTQIQSAIGELGFLDPQRAAQSIQQHIASSVQTTGRLPDVMEVSRSLRQSEIEYEKAIISRYKNQKSGAVAQSANPVTPSPPVLEQQPAKGEGWDSATKRIMGKLRGG